MEQIEEKIQSLIGNQIEYKGEVVTVLKGKVTSTMVVLQTDRYPVNFPKYSDEFKNLKPLKTEKIESKMNTENKPQIVNQNQLTTSSTVNQSLNGYEKLNTLFDELLDNYNSGDDKQKEKIKNDLDVILPIANAKISLFKVGLTAVSIANKV